MVSVTQRITQYNKQVGQPRGGLINPQTMTETTLGDSLGVIDHKTENVHASIVGMAVDYLTRLARVFVPAQQFSRALESAFRVSLLGAERIDEVFDGIGVTEAARLALAHITPATIDGKTYAVIDEAAVRAACQLAGYDVGKRNDPRLWNPTGGVTGVAPDDTTVQHVLQMVERSEAFFSTFGPITKDGFVFAEGFALLRGDRGGYTDLVDSGDGDFLTKDTLWEFKVSATKPTKDHTLQLLMYFLMGKESGLPEFAELSRVGIFNPRRGSIHRLVAADVPVDVIETIRRDVIGYAS